MKKHIKKDGTIRLSVTLTKDAYVGLQSSRALLEAAFSKIGAPVKINLSEMMGIAVKEGLRALKEKGDKFNAQQKEG